MNLDDMIRGTRCVELARLDDDLVIPMRAISEREAAQIDERADLAARIALPNWLDQGSAAQARIRASKRWALFVATAALDPHRLLAGERAPMFSATDAGKLVSADVDVLIRAQRAAQARANPALDEAQTREAMEAMRKREGRGLDALRARNASAADFFGVPSIEVTDWQLIYFQEIAR